MAQIVTTSELPGVTSRQPDSDNLAGGVIEETRGALPKDISRYHPTPIG